MSEYLRFRHLTPNDLSRIRWTLTLSDPAVRPQLISNLRRELADILGTYRATSVSDIDLLYCLGVQLKSVWDESVPLFDQDTFRYIEDKFGKQASPSVLAFYLAFEGLSFDETVEKLIANSDFKPDLGQRPVRDVVEHPDLEDTIRLLGASYRH